MLSEWTVLERIHVPWPKSIPDISIWYTSGQRLFAAKHKIVLCAKRNQARIFFKVGKGPCKVSIPVVLAMHVFLQVIYARI